MWALYNLLLVLCAPVWWVWMLSRTRRRAERPNWHQRLGYVSFPPKGGRPRIWFHAVSVGEVLACLPILKETRALVPNVEIVLSVTTSSGHKAAREQAKDLFDHLIYFPIDLPGAVLRSLRSVDPNAVVIMETELWMNFLWAAKKLGVPTLVVNGRISDRSFRNSSKVAAFYRALLSFVDQALMQTVEDARRIQSLGAAHAEVLGNCKFDQAVEGLDANVAEWRKTLGIPDGRQVVVVGSTRSPEEEDLVLEAIAGLDLQKVAVVHAPRHLERIPELFEKVVRRLGAVSLRSEGGGGGYILLDTYGELSKVYAVADVVVIGGGFGDFGGQNLLQPLAHGKPVLHGPHMQNFAEVAQAAAKENCTRTCSTAEELKSELLRLLGDAKSRQEMAQAARSFVGQNLGASRRYAERIQSAISPRT